MNEITVLSGKGGAGKTQLLQLWHRLPGMPFFATTMLMRPIFTLFFSRTIKESHSFSSGKKAVIQQKYCTQCGLCKEYCRFDAIHLNVNSNLEINPYQCEGCRLCERICPENAITITENYNNFWYVSDTRFGTLIHARMGPGEENSGKLVTQVREKARDIANENHTDFIISDGPPGIGCSAISSVTGTDLVLLVIEPTLSGLHDAKRLVKLVNNFNVPVLAVINKFDLNPEGSEKVLLFLEKNKIRLIGKINFENEVVESMIAGQTIIEFSPESKISKEIYYIWEEIRKQLAI